MLKKVIITNYLGETMEYNIDGVEAENPSGLIITSIDGLGPVKANINMTDLTTTDGQMFNSARLSGRNIVIKALFTHATSIEEARLLSYKYFPIKKKLKIRVETDNRIAETEGYVESNEPDIFSEQSGCQISILCENPYFDGGKIGYTFGDTVPLFKFKFGNEDLNEPLIKLSEQIDVTTVREIVYEGDADTGMEIAVEVPSDDIMDTFKVTGIEILGENDKKISIDTSKMVNQVPNSASKGTTKKGSFILDDTRYKFYCNLPESVVWNLHSVLYQNQVHSFNAVDNGDHLLIDPHNPGHIVENPKISNSNYLSAVFNIDDTLYGLKSGNYSSDGFYRLNVNEWEFIVDTGEATNTTRYIKGVVYNDKVHALFTTKSSGSPALYQNFHYIFDGSNWTFIENLSSNYSSLFPSGNSSDNNFYSFEKSRVVVYDNKIHVFGGNNFPRAHYVWNGTTWTTSSDQLPVSTSEYTSVTVYKNKLHLFQRINSQLTRQYIYNNGSNSWGESFSLPFGYAGEPIADADYLYLLSNDTNDIYIEAVNNDHLIENDKLVINTIKGKKGVTLYRGFNQYNVLNALDKDSTWLQLQRGVNRFSYTAETGAEDMQITISTNKWYEGV